LKDPREAVRTVQSGVAGSTETKLKVKTNETQEDPDIKTVSVNDAVLGGV
jgi:hypothetical protein